MHKYDKILVPKQNCVAKQCITMIKFIFWHRTLLSGLMLWLLVTKPVSSQISSLNDKRYRYRSHVSLALLICDALFQNRNEHHFIFNQLLICDAWPLNQLLICDKNIATPRNILQGRLVFLVTTTNQLFVETDAETVFSGP